MLILGCQSSDIERKEIDCIKNSCEMLDIFPTICHVNSQDELHKSLLENREIDFIYLSAHGDKIGFEGEENDIDISWRSFSEMLCETEVMSDNCIVMLSCCRGGLNEVAYTLFSICDKVQYVVGPRQSLSHCELSVAFQIFLFNKLERNLDAVKSAEIVESSIGTRLVCFDRIETESSFAYMKFLEYIDSIESGDDDLLNKLIEDTSRAVAHETLKELQSLIDSKIELKLLEKELIDINIAETV